METLWTSDTAAFFDLLPAKEWDAVHLLVQSAYVLDDGQVAPGEGRIHFHALLGHAYVERGRGGFFHRKTSAAAETATPSAPADLLPIDLREYPRAAAFILPVITEAVIVLKASERGL